jgi:hypothetical protein
MPTIQRFATSQIRIYASDHPPPHFHVVLNDGRECLVEIESLRILTGTVPKPVLAEALAWATDHRALLHAQWQEYNP